MLDKTFEQRISAASVASPQPAYEPTILAAALHLSIQQGQVLCILMAHSLTTARIIGRSTGLSLEGRRTAIHRLRARLEAKKIRIITHPGLGYSIPAEDRERIVAFVEKFNGR